MFVLPVARQRDPCSRHDAISFKDLTSTSVDPARVITPLDDSRIWIGGFPGTFTFPVLAVSDFVDSEESSKSRTSSLRICRIKSLVKQINNCGLG